MPNLNKILDTETNLKERFIPDFDVLKKVVKDLKKKKKKIVLTQGVYDLIHEGHALYLERAREYGDVLIVGIDSDEFTRQRKGPNRPIVPQAERVKMLIHLRHVDVVTIREIHHGIGDLIKLVEPDVLITSSSTADFTNDMKKEYGDVCKKIITLPPQATTSTTARIRNLTIDGAESLAREIKDLTDRFLEKIRKI
jgi:rfaE bifunctional protein nucleotidyltransferase chain/domain